MRNVWPQQNGTRSENKFFLKGMLPDHFNPIIGGHSLTSTFPQTSLCLDISITKVYTNAHRTKGTGSINSVSFLWRCDPTQVMASSFLKFLDHTRRTKVGRTPLDELSARRRDLYLTIHDTHNRQISMPPVGFEPKISAGRSPAEILGSNSTGGMDICLL